MVRQWWAEGKYTPQDYLHLVMLAHIGPAGGFTIENVEAFCQEWNLSESQFRQAAAALVREGIVEETIVSSPDLIGVPSESDPPAAERDDTGGADG